MPVCEAPSISMHVEVVARDDRQHDAHSLHGLAVLAALSQLMTLGEDARRAWSCRTPRGPEKR